MSEWQPIETAPKDGSYILLTGGEPDYLWDGERPEPPVLVCVWQEPRPTKANILPDAEWRIACAWEGGFYNGYLNPTHWMPLPTPPKPSPVP
jgi:hypothetical protein